MTYKKLIIGIVIVAVLVGGYIYFTGSKSVGSASPSGVTFSTSPIAMGTFTGVVAPANSGSVVYSALNSGSDRVITSADLFVSALASPAVTVYWATSTSATATTTTQYISQVTLGTSGAYYLASTTPTGVSASSDASRVWPGGTYLDVIFSTSTGSTATGYAGVRYLSQ